MVFTKLQTEFIDRELTKGAYVAFPLSIFKSEQYKQWKRERRRLAINRTVNKKLTNKPLRDGCA